MLASAPGVVRPLLDASGDPVGDGAAVGDPPDEDAPDDEPVEAPASFPPLWPFGGLLFALLEPLGAFAELSEPDQ
jgi:hypothetical protein